MFTPGGTTLDRHHAIARVREIRAEHARAAAFYANRVAQARATGRYKAATRWTEEYRRAAARCRVLGEMLRSERETA